MDVAQGSDVAQGKEERSVREGSSVVCVFFGYENPEPVVSTVVHGCDGMDEDPDASRRAGVFAGRGAVMWWGTEASYESRAGPGWTRPADLSGGELLPCVLK